MSVEFRKLTQHDFENVASVQIVTLPVDFMSRGGTSFLVNSLYPALILENVGSVVAIDQISRNVVGFVFLCNTQQLLISLFKSHPIEMAKLAFLNVRELPGIFSYLSLMKLSGKKLPSTELAWIGVLPEFQGQSVGSGLINYGIQLAKNNGSSEIWVKTLVKTGSNVDFYQKAGFVRFANLAGRVVLKISLSP